MSDIYLSITETPTVVTLTNPLISSNVAQSVTVTNVVSVSVVTMPAISVSGGLTNAELRASSVTVALDANSLSALEQVTVTIGAAVSISNFPSTQAIAGTVTANLPRDTFTESGVAIAADEGGGRPSFGVQLGYDDPTNGFQLLSPSNGLPISGTVTASIAPNQTDFFGDGNPTLHSLFESSALAVGSLPAISGTVTARLQDASGNNLTSTSIGGVQRLNVSLASAATAGGTLPSFINIHGGTDGSVARTMLLDSSGRTVVTVSNFPATQPVSLTSTTVTVSNFPATQPVSGTVAISSLPNVNLAGGNVIAVSNFPATQPVSGTVTANSSNGSLTTRFGTPATANVSFATSAVTNANRKYLLIQNVTTGSNVITVGIGFTPTTTQGIQLTAGAGITFESSYIPTGAVYVLSSVTASNFTILEA